MAIEFLMLSISAMARIAWLVLLYSVLGRYLKITRLDNYRRNKVSIIRNLLTGLAVFSLAMFSAIAPINACAESVNIAAAADLKFALEEIALAFEHETRQQVALSFGSSGTFATQISNGAPFQMFLSADENYVLMLHKQQLTIDQGVLYALGRIAVIAPKDSILSVDGELKGLAELVKSNRLKRFAIANPEHAPYGQRAQEALQHAGLWDGVRPYLVYGENVSQAAQFALGGSAEGGIIALSLAKSPQMQNLAQYALIPAEWHSPLKQRMVLLKNAGATAKAFYLYLQQPSARAVLARYGFTLPTGTD